MSPKQRLIDGGLRPPFLQCLTLLPERLGSGYPFDLAILEAGRLELRFERPVSYFVGEGGTGKSTLLEAIAARIGFNIGGGSRDHAYGGTRPEAGLAQALRLAWLPKVTNGFFLRAESYFNFASYVEELRREYPGDIAHSYGARDLHGQSHAQALFALFDSRIGTTSRALCLLDEPETALSPLGQLEFLRRLKRWEDSGKAQFIIASHAPILLAYPGADLFSFDGGRIRRIDVEETQHWRATRDFLTDPAAVLTRLFSETPAPPQRKAKTRT
jgi:predicted ATPase